MHNDTLRIKKQFDLPSVTVKKGNFICFEVEVIGVIGEGPSKIRGIEYDAPERNRIVSTVSFTCEPNRLINLGMNLDAGLCAPELCPSKDRHAQVDGSGINGIEPSVKFKFFGDTFGLGNRHNVRGKLLKDSRGSEAVRFGKNASVDGNLSKSQVKRSFGMSNSDICEFSKTMTANELTIHNDQHMTPVRWCHSGCPVFVYDYQSFEVTFREKLHNLCENIFANVHICSNLHLGAKEQNSKGRQGFERLACCA